MQSDPETLLLELVQQVCGKHLHSLGFTDEEMENADLGDRKILTALITALRSNGKGKGKGQGNDSAPAGGHNTSNAQTGPFNNGATPPKGKGKGTNKDKKGRGKGKEKGKDKFASSGNGGGNKGRGKMK